MTRAQRKPRKKGVTASGAAGRTSPALEQSPAKNLVLGWKLNADGEPDYWMAHGENPELGDQPASSLVSVPAMTLGSNTIIVAQSGSGKSSFLARIVEELLLNSSAHCLIVDPNSDFRYFLDTGNPGDWSNFAYDVKRHSGKLHTERDAAEFGHRWSAIKGDITILTGGIPERVSIASRRAPTIRWRYVPRDFLMDGLDSVHRVEMRHCHTFFSRLADVCETVVKLKRLGSEAEEDDISGSLDILRKVEPVFASLAEAHNEGRIHGDDVVARIIEEELSQHVPLPGGKSYSEARLLGRQYGSFRRVKAGKIAHKIERSEGVYYRRIARDIDRATTAFGHFTEATGRHYFALLEDLRGEGILSDQLGDTDNSRVEILDLPSIEARSNRNLLVASFLDLAIDRATRAWQNAKAETYADPDAHPTRFPFFVVLDEAHNLVPADDATADPSLKLVRDRFRVIAAEGRKLGLYLILATQRPDKIDKFVLSECQNKAVMRLENESSLKFVADALGIEEAKSLMRRRCLGVGYRVLLTGRWTNYVPVAMYPAPRRTMEGGGSLEASDWAPKPPVPSGVNAK